MKKHLTIFAALIFASHSVLFAQEGPAAEETVEPAPSKPATKKKEMVDLMAIDIPVATAYIFRGADKSGQDPTLFPVALAVQPSVDLSFGGGFSANVWYSAAVMDRDNNKGADEMDLTLAWSQDTSIGGFSAGVIGYLYPNAGGPNQEIFIGYSLPVMLSPSLTVYGDPASGGYTYTALGLGHDIDDFSIGLNVGYQAPYVDPTDEDSGGYIRDITLSLGYSFDLGDGMGLGLNANASYLLEPERVNGNDEPIVAWAGFGFSKVISGTYE